VGAAPAPGAPGALPKEGYYAPVIGPGGSWSSVLLVSNASAQTMPIIVFATDGLTASTSGAVYSNYGQKLTGAGEWLTPSSQTVIVPADGEAKVPFTVKVPVGATPGDHLAGIGAEFGGPTPATASGIHANVVARVLIGVLVKVPGPASFQVAVGPPSVGTGPENITEILTPITDTGRTMGRPTDEIILTGPHHVTTSLKRAVGTLLPGGTAQFPIYWPSALSGHYSVVSCISGSGLAHPVCASAEGTVRRSRQTATPIEAPSPPKGRSPGTPGTGPPLQAVAQPVPSRGLPGWALAMMSSAGGGAIVAGSLIIAHFLRLAGARSVLRRLPHSKRRRN